MTSGVTFPVPCLSREGCGLSPSLWHLAQRGFPVALRDTHEPAWHLAACWYGRQCLGWQSGHRLLHSFSLVLSGAPEVITRARRDAGAFVQWGCEMQTCRMRSLGRG